jgi:hypothetical protein
MVEDVIGQSRFSRAEEHSGDVPLAAPFSGEQGLSVEETARALGRKFSGNRDIRTFTVTVENLSEGYKTFAVLDGPQEEDRRVAG